MVTELARILTQHVRGHVQRHVVPIFLHFTRGEDSHTAIFTSVVVSVRQNWLMVTAGHCIRDVEEMTRAGWLVHRTRLFDGLHSGASFRDAVPFDWLAALPTAPFTDEYFDYGLIFIDGISQALLKANGVVPIDEEAWDHEVPDGVGLYTIVGVSGPQTSSTPDKATVNILMAAAERLDERPAQLPETDAPRWYGRVTTKGVDTLEGLSGGPIFAMRLEPTKQVRYWLVAFQSAQAPRFPQDPFVAGMLARPLGRLLQRIVDEHEAKMAEKRILSNGGPGDREPLRHDPDNQPASERGARSAES